MLVGGRRGWDERRGGRNATNGVAIVEGKRLSPGELPSSREEGGGGGGGGGNARPFTFYG